MSQMKIEELLNKYLDSETTIEEEKYLLQYFQSENIPENLLIYKQIFDYIRNSKNETIPSVDFDNVLLAKLKTRKFNKISKIKRTIYYISGIAATILIFIALFFSFKKHDKIEQSFNSQTKVIENTVKSKSIDVKNPEESYRITLKTLLFVSKSMNEGTKKLNKLSAFNKGLEEAKKISKFEDCQKFIINN